MNTLPVIPGPSEALTRLTTSHTGLSPRPYKPESPPSCCSLQLEHLHLIWPAMAQS